MKVNLFANISVFTSSLLEAMFGLLPVCTAHEFFSEMYQLWPLSPLYLEHLLKHHERHQV